MAGFVQYSAGAASPRLQTRTAWSKAPPGAENDEAENIGFSALRASALTRRFCRRGFLFFSGARGRAVQQARRTRAAEKQKEGGVAAVALPTGHP